MVLGCISTQLSSAKLTTADHHHPIGGKLMHIIRPAVTVTSSRIARGGKAPAKRFSHPGMPSAMEHGTSVHGLPADG